MVFKKLKGPLSDPQSQSHLLLLPAEYILSGVSWLLFLVVFIIEMERYTPWHSWMVRFPICFICAGEIAKLRFIVILAERKDYFFYLYIVYFCLQAILTLMALFWYPAVTSMSPVESTIDQDYEARILSTLHKHVKLHLQCCAIYLVSGYMSGVHLWIAIRVSTE